MADITSSAPAICGTRFGLTKLAASTRGTPAAASFSQSSARTSGESVLSSFCRPSRGPTSTISMRIRRCPVRADRRGPLLPSEHLIEHFVVVLAQLRSGPAHLSWRLGEAGDYILHREWSDLRVLDGDDVLAGGVL